MVIEDVTIQTETSREKRPKTTDVLVLSHFDCNVHE
jgi:hypothetical protein